MPTGAPAARVHQESREVPTSGKVTSHRARPQVRRLVLTVFGS